MHKIQSSTARCVDAGVWADCALLLWSLEKTMSRYVWADCALLQPCISNHETQWVGMVVCIGRCQFLLVQNISTVCRIFSKKLPSSALVCKIFSKMFSQKLCILNIRWKTSILVLWLANVLIFRVKIKFRGGHGVCVCVFCSQLKLGTW